MVHNHVKRAPTFEALGAPPLVTLNGGYVRWHGEEVVQQNRAMGNSWLRICTAPATRIGVRVVTKPGHG